MALETKNQININYNTFFYATMCHVCKRFRNNVPLKRCSGCKLISYCSPQHQKQHWPQHKLLCKTIQDVLKDDGLEKLKITSDDSNYAKVTLMETVGKKMGSLLYVYERQMFWFPKECAVCYKRNVESLIVCQKCANSFCKDHEDDIAHKNACTLLLLCLHINLSDMNKKHDIKKHLDMFLEFSSNTEFKMGQISSIANFIEVYANIQKVPKMLHYILSADLSEYLTRPLTLLYAMKVLRYIPKRKELVIHVLAMHYILDYRILEMWETFLHIIPRIEMSLMIVMIGRALPDKSPSLSICNNCSSQEKKILLEFYRGSYEDYVRSSSFVKPNFAIGFNVNIQPEENDIIFPKIKEITVQMVAEQNCSFVLTNHTKQKLEKQVNRINTILNRKVDPVYCGVNPFSSLKPFRCITKELVFSNNSFVAIYRSLCS